MRVRPPEQTRCQEINCAVGDANVLGVTVDGTMPAPRSHEFQQHESGALEIMAHNDSNPSIKPAVVSQRSIPDAGSGAHHLPLCSAQSSCCGVGTATPFILLYSHQFLGAKEVTKAAAAVKLCL